MPTPTPPSPQKSGPVWFMPEIAENLATNLSMNTARIKLVDMDTFKGKLTESAQEQTILLTLGEATQVNPGGGRSALITRPLYVQIVTVSYKDPGGRSENALQDHWLLEDQVAVVLSLFRPVQIQSGHPLVFGKASPVNFDLPVDPGRYRSTMTLAVTYQQNISCNAPVAD